MYSKVPSALKVKDAAWPGPVTSARSQACCWSVGIIIVGENSTAGDAQGRLLVRFVKIIASDGFLIYLYYRNRHRSRVAIIDAVVGFIGESCRCR